MQTGIIIKYRTWDCEIETSEYTDGGTRIEFVELETEEAIVTITVNQSHTELEENEVVIKNDPEIISIMEKHGLIGRTGRLIDEDASLPIFTLSDARMKHFTAV